MRRAESEREKVCSTSTEKEICCSKGWLLCQQKQSLLCSFLLVRSFCPWSDLRAYIQCSRHALVQHTNQEVLYLTGLSDPCCITTLVSQTNYNDRIIGPSNKGHVVALLITAWNVKNVIRQQAASCKKVALLHHSPWYAQKKWTSGGTLCSFTTCHIVTRPSLCKRHAFGKFNHDSLGNNPPILWIPRSNSGA